VSGDKSVDLNVKKMATGENHAPFYLKAGDMHADDPEHILWTLTINAMNLEVDGDVRVEDEVQGGHKLVTDSFSITTTGMKPGYYGGDTAIEDFKAAFPGSTFTVDASGKITITIPKDQINKTGVLIFYRTKVENDTQKEFKNNTKVWYQVKGETAVVAKEVNASVANINANGGVDGDQSIPSIPTTTTVATTTTTTTEAPTTTTTTTESTTASTTTTESTTASTTASTTTTESTTASTTASTTTTESTTASTTASTTTTESTTASTTASTTTTESTTASTTASTTTTESTTASTTASTTTTESTTASTTAATTTTESTTASTTAATTTSEGSSTTEGSTTGVTTGETTDATTVTPAPETTTTVTPDLPNTGTTSNTAVILAGIIVTISAMFVLVSKKAEQN